MEVLIVIEQIFIYILERPNQGSSRSNSGYSNRSGQQGRNRGNFPNYSVRPQ